PAEDDRPAGPVDDHRLAIGVIAGDLGLGPGEGVLHRAGGLALQHGPPDHVLHHVAVAEAGVLVGHVVLAGGGGEDPTGSQGVVEAAAVAGGDPEPGAAGLEVPEDPGDLAAVDVVGVGPHDRLVDVL